MAQLTQGSSAVAVTGLGVVQPGAGTVDEYWSLLLAGKSTAVLLDPTERDRDLASGIERIGCPVTEPLDRHFAHREARRLDRFTKLALVAAAQALEDAGPLEVPPGRTAIVVGVGFGGLAALEAQIVRHAAGARPDPMTIPSGMPNAAAANLAIRFGWTGPATTVSAACASSAYAIGQGAGLIRSGAADVVLAGGSEAALSPFILDSFSQLQTLSRRTGAPAEACRPFDLDRDGFVMGEGAAFCVLESAEHARARGARAYARLAGYGANSDAAHLVAPAAGAETAADCVRAALRDAGLAPEDIGHVNAHGTATRANDAAEALALHAVFGEVPPITAPKSVIGHQIGAAGAAEFAAACLTLQHRLIPPTANLEEVDRDLRLDVVHGEPRPLPPGAVLSTSFGFGGHNGALVLTSGDRGVARADQSTVPQIGGTR